MIAQHRATELVELAQIPQAVDTDLAVSIVVADVLDADAVANKQPEYQGMLRSRGHQTKGLLQFLARHTTQSNGRGVDPTFSTLASRDREAAREKIAIH